MKRRSCSAASLASRNGTTDFPSYASLVPGRHEPTLARWVDKAFLQCSAFRPADARTRHNRWMGSWVVWTIVAAAFTLGELHTNSFYLAPFAVGGAIAVVLAAIGAGGLVAVVSFAAAAILFLLLLRPLAVRRRAAPTLRTGAAALIGQPALVLERIANREGVGTVKIGGEVWTARAYDEEQVIAAGGQVEVVEIRGATALVMP
jgi:membrane protein implicated in regulation of membrane protease activity